MKRIKQARLSDKSPKKILVGLEKKMGLSSSLTKSPKKPRRKIGY